MNVHLFQHVHFEGLGVIEQWISKHNHVLSATRFYQDDQLPEVDNFDLLIVMGGPMGIYDDHKYPWLSPEKRFIEQVIASGKAVLGICLGAQLIADVLGAEVYQNNYKEIGWFPVELTPDGRKKGLFQGFPDRFEALHWHGDTFRLPGNACHLVKNDVCTNQAFIYNDNVLGLQFHMEMTMQNAENLIPHCADELISAPYIQAPEVILTDPARFDQANGLMLTLLENFISC
jgi:GMP synthase-like glutamine amidotransferase